MLARLLRLNALSLRERELIVDTFVKNKESDDVLIGFLAAHVIFQKSQGKVKAAKRVD